MSIGNHVKITMAELGKSHAQVFVDGVEITKVLDVAFYYSHDSYPLIVVKFWPESVEIEGEVVVEPVEHVELG